MSLADALVERDLAAAPGVLPPAHLPLVRHRLWQASRLRTELLGVTSTVRGAEARRTLL